MPRKSSVGITLSGTPMPRAMQAAVMRVRRRGLAMNCTSDANSLNFSPKATAISSPCGVIGSAAPNVGSSWSMCGRSECRVISSTRCPVLSSSLTSSISMPRIIAEIPTPK